MTFYYCSPFSFSSFKFALALCFIFVSNFSFVSLFFAALHSLHIVTAIFISYSTFRLLKAIAKSIENLYIWLFLVKLSLLTLFAFFLVSVLCFFFDGFLSKVIALSTIAIWKSYNYIERAIKKRCNRKKYHNSIAFWVHKYNFRLLFGSRIKTYLLYQSNKHI